MRAIEQISATYAWYQGYGNRVDRQALATYVHNLEHPDIWDANHVSGVRAGGGAAIEQVLRHADRVFAHCAHRCVIADPLTPEAFVARLALDDFKELPPTIHMVLEGPLAARGADIELRAVATDDDWRVLYELVRLDLLEGKAARGMTIEDDIARGIVAGYRSKAAVSQFFVAAIDGVICAYGSTVVGPYSMGIVEALFTLPAYRRRGIATAMIRHAVAHARECGMGPMLIGALADEAPKRLYASLGFEPRCLTRQYLREALRRA
jgi:GNAT superfamily N-acetyltransferase